MNDGSYGINIDTKNIQTVILSKKSRFVYVTNISLAVLMFIASRYIGGPWGIAISVFIVVFAAYSIIEVKSFVLYMDNDGVWLESGILPWKKVRYGAKWRDLREAGYYPSFGSWVTRSWRIVITNRFTLSFEIDIRDMSRGPEAVTMINNTLQDMVRRGEIIS